MIELVRFASFSDRMIGRLTYEGRDFWSVEKPWKDNEPFVSCIPNGCYELARRDSPKFGPNTWEIVNVPGRSHILIHAGNTSNDVVGCIALGVTLYDHLGGVGNSRKAIQEFYELTESQDKLVITIKGGQLR